VEYRFCVEIAGAEHDVAVESLGGSRYRLTHDGRTRIVDARRLQSAWSLVPDGGGPAQLVDVEGAPPELTIVVAIDGMPLPVRVSDARRRIAGNGTSRRAPSGPSLVKSPIPGKVVKVMVRAGDQVKGGQGLIVVEAMKMENELRAPRDGRVASVSAAEGTAVESGQTLATLE
jgi:biotin carboxyl carrier protein